MYGNFKRLTLITLDPVAHARTCGYWYVIQNESMSHTAFASREHLMTWLGALGLQLTAELPEHGTHSYQAIKGQYSRVMHMSYDAFYALKGERVRVCDNAEYTLGIITKDGGIPTLHHMNCNKRDRVIFDYHESRAMVG